ncbi:MAG: ABC transporter substrate-binding protein [Gammaproteobacteria bacterium]|nr:ABC transporter substrate-binding protein [Gammaproteobacteria bacterium]
MTPGRWFAFAVALLVGAGPALAGAAQAAAAAPRRVADDLARSVEVGAAPLRIVSLTPGASEMLFAAGAGAQLIATVEYSSEPPAARAVPRIGDVAAIDMERLVALRPGVVIAWPAGGNPAQRAKIAALGIPLYEQQVARLGDLPGSLRRLGVLAGTEPRAERAAAALQARLDALERTYSAGTAGGGPTVLLQVWNRPVYTIGGRHLMSDALALCGARNVFADLPEPAPLVDTEAVIARDPDIILAAAPPREGAAWVADWQRFPSLAAVRNHRVVAFENQALSRLGPSVLDATEDLCRTIARLSRGSS